MKKLFLLVYLLLECAGAIAATQDHAQIRAIVTTFVQQQTATQPGKVSFQVNEMDSRISLSPCTRLEAFLPSGSQLIGKTSVGVRCLDKNGWSVFIPVQVKISLDLLVSARQLPLGHTLREEDITSQTMEITQTGGITDPKQALGKVLRYGIAAGQLLRPDMLRLPFSVKQGQVVQIATQGDGFSIRNEGVALNNASEGENVQVRVSAGRVVSGVARADGVVEIR